MKVGIRVNNMVSRCKPIVTGENRVRENVEAASVLREKAPLAFRSQMKLDSAIAELRKRHDKNPWAGANLMTFPQFVRAYAEYAMNC